MAFNWLRNCKPASGAPAPGKRKETGQRRAPGVRLATLRPLRKPHAKLQGDRHRHLGAFKRLQILQLELQPENDRATGCWGVRSAHVTRPQYTARWTSVSFLGLTGAGAVASAPPAPALLPQ